jgi:hypothetical protein
MTEMAFHCDVAEKLFDSRRLLCKAYLSGGNVVVTAQRNVLVNRGRNTVEGFERLKRLIDVAAQANSIRNDNHHTARSRHKYDSDKGYDMQRHGLWAGAGNI